MGHSRGRKVKSAGYKEADNVFWMSLEEAKAAISEKPEYEALAERWERRVPKHKAA